MKRIAVFLDGSNFFYTQKKLGWNIDNERLLDYCKEYGEVVEAVYYTGITTDSSQKKYHDKLAYIGYSLVTKPVKTICDHISGETTQKANLDIEIVLDMFNMIDRYDMAILISGDGDFERALQQLKSRGKEVKVISTRGCVATELVHATGINYIDLLAIRESIERKAFDEIKAA
ncbi:MAG: NYN domain-containing protein [Ruminococcaceae bacterium]|nr:NYN domain-containing protein [Oscillospiraceae bacterium]